MLHLCPFFQLTLCHLDDLIRWLRLSRAVHLVRNRHDAFELLPPGTRLPLPPSAGDVAALLLRAARPGEALAALHGFIDRHVAAAAEAKAEEGEEAETMAGRRLVDYLVYHLQEEGQDELAARLAETMPGDLLVGHAVELFVALVKKEVA